LVSSLIITKDTRPKVFFTRSEVNAKWRGRLLKLFHMQDYYFYVRSEILTAANIKMNACLDVTTNYKLSTRDGSNIYSLSPK